jgi:hypothetical protein
MFALLMFLLLGSLGVVLFYGGDTALYLIAGATLVATLLSVGRVRLRAESWGEFFHLLVYRELKFIPYRRWYNARSEASKGPSDTPPPGSAEST